MIGLRCLIVLLGLGLVAGCSGQGKKADYAAPETGELGEVNELLRAAAGSNNRPPSKVSDLEKYKGNFPRAYESIKAGTIVVVWGSQMQGEGGGGTGGSVLAYYKDVPNSGGYVLLTSGAIRQMSASDFAAAKGGAAPAPAH